MEQEEKKRLMPFLIWLCITVFYCYQYILRVLPNIVSQEVMANFNIGASEFGSFAGIYYIGYIALHIPIGVALVKMGARNVMAICIALTALGLVPLSSSMDWGSVLVGRALTGIGSSAASVGALQIFRILYPEKFARMLGLMISLGLITVVYAGKILTPFILEAGLEATVNILLYSGIALAVLIFFLLPKSERVTSGHTLLADVKSIIFNYKLILTSIFAGLMVGPMEGFADAWGNSFLMNVYDMEKITANSLVLSISLGMSFGCIFLPYLADKVGSYFGVTIASGIMMIICFAYILGGAATPKMLNYLCIIIGIFSAYQVVILAKIATFVSSEKSGMAGAVANMIIMMFGWFFHNSIGATLDQQWGGQFFNGMKQYGAEAFVAAISIIPTGIAAAVIGLSAIALISMLQGRTPGKTVCLARE